jgi:CelD/BcsL family acetyltransferase involved in cellulose biosynthesis
MFAELAVVSEMPERNQMRPGLVTQVTEGLGELPSLQSRWEELFLSRANEPSLSFEWTSAMARHHVRGDDRAFLVSVERDGRLVAVVPLVLRTHKVMGRAIRLLSPISEQYNTHSDLLVESHEEALVEAVVSGLCAIDAEWDCFRMARLLEENPLVPVLRRAIRGAGHLQGTHEGLPAYVLELPPSYDEYLAERSPKFRNHLKRVERKLQAAGTVEVHELNHVSRFDEAFGALLRVEQASWKQSHGTAITAVERQTGFYRHLAETALERDRIHLQWLTIAGRPIAYNLGYLTASGYHYLKTSYDHEFRPMSPATYLRARLIEGLVARGLGRLDFPGEPYEWEAQWTGTVRWRTVLSAYPRTVRGRMLATIDRLRHRDRSERRVTHVNPRASHGPRREGA